MALAVAAHRRRRQLRTRCLAQLRAGRPEAAVRAAAELHALAPDADSLRLLAVARLLQGITPPRRNRSQDTAARW